TFFIEILLFLNELVFYEAENNFYFDFDIIRNDYYMYYKDQGYFSKKLLFIRKQEIMYRNLGLKPWSYIKFGFGWSKKDGDKYIAERDQNLENEYDYYRAKRDYFDNVLSNISLEIKEKKLILTEYSRLNTSFHEKLSLINGKSPLFILNEENVELGLGLRKRYYRKTAYYFLWEIKPEYNHKSRDFFYNKLDERKKLRLKTNLIRAFSQKNWKEREWAVKDYGFLVVELKDKSYAQVIEGIEDHLKDEIATKLGKYFYTRSNREKLEYEQIKSAVDALIAINTEKSLNVLKTRLHNIDFKDLREKVSTFLDDTAKQKDELKIEVPDVNFSYPLDLKLGVEGIKKAYNLSSQFGHNKEITSLVISPDCKFVITGSTDNTVRIWDLTSGKMLNIIPSQTYGRIILTITQDGKFLVSSALKNRINVFELTTGKVIRQFSGHDNHINRLLLTNDGNRLISASQDKEIKIWDFNSCDLLHKIQADSTYDKIIITSNDKFLIGSVPRNKIDIWDLKTFNLQSSHKINNDWGGKGIAVSLDSKHIITTNINKKVDFLDFQTGKLMYRIRSHSKYVSSVILSPNGKYLATFGEDERNGYRLKIWDFKTRGLIKTFENKRYTLNKVIFTPDSKNLIFQYGTLFNLWNLEKGEFIYNNIPRLESGYGYNHLTTIVSPDGQYGISLFRNNEIKIWKIETGKVIRTLKLHTSIGKIVISNDCQYLVGSCEDYTVKAWNYKTGEFIKSFSGHKEKVLKIWISNDNKFVAGCSYDGTLKIWNFETNQLIRSFGTLSTVLNAEKEWERWGESMNSFVITPDMKYVVGCLHDGNINIWDYETKKRIHVIKPFSYRIDNIFLLGKNKIIVSSTRIIKIWDIITGKQLKILGLFVPNCHFVLPEGRN
ncbi:hypothetical protein LCGC14_1810520, partial [marine sediment metagenome]